MRIRKALQRLGRGVKRIRVKRVVITKTEQALVERLSVDIVKYAYQKAMIGRRYQ